MTASNRSAPLTRAENNLLQALSARWAMHILLALRASDASVRFGEIQERVPGISSRVLSGRLADLERSGWCPETSRLHDRSASRTDLPGTVSKSRGSSPVSVK